MTPRAPGRTTSPIATPPRPAPWAAMAAALVAAVTCLNILPNDYCYDDVPIVRQNVLVQGPVSWQTVWTSDYWHASRDTAPDRDLLYRPLTISSFRLVRLVAGPSAMPQHVVNLALHVLLTVLVVRLTRRFGGGNAAAWIAGLGFAALPIHTDVLANVVGRADLLAGVGVALAMECQALSHRAAHRGGRIALRTLAALSGFLALGGKESGIAVLPAVVAMDWLTARSRDGAATANSLRTLLSQLAASLWRCAHLLVPLAIYLWLRSVALEGQWVQSPPDTRTVNVLVDAPWWQRILGVFQLWGMYWAKTFWPAVLSIKYSINAITPATRPWHPHVLFGLCMTILPAWIAWRAWSRGQRGLTLAALLMVLAYLPTSNAFVLMQVFFAERLWYLPSIFAVMFIALSIGWILPPSPRPRPDWLRLAGVALVLAMMARSVARNAEWRNDETLLAAAYRDTPESIGVLQLYGHWHTRHGDLEAGIRLLQRALTIDPGYIDAHRSLGAAFFKLQRPDLALKHLQVAAMHAPDDPHTAAALHTARSAVTEKHSARLDLLRQRADAHPPGVAAERAYLSALRDSGMLDEALRRFRERQSTFEQDSGWQVDYAVTLLFMGRRDEAIERYGLAVALDRDNPQVMAELAMLLLERRAPGDLDEAWGLSERAIELAPDAPTILAARAELLAQRGQPGAAVAAYEKAIANLPPGSPQRELFRQRVRAMGGK